MTNLNKIFSGKMNDQLPIREGFYCSFFDDAPTVTGFLYSGGNAWFVHTEGRYFTEEEIAGAENKIVIDEGLYEYDDFNYEDHPYFINGEGFEIVGLAELSSTALLFTGKQDLYKKISPAEKLRAQMGDANMYHGQDDEIIARINYLDRAVIIPYTTYQKAGYIPSIVNMRFYISNEFPLEKIVATLGEIFPNADIVLPMDMQRLYKPIFNYQMMRTALLLLIPLLYMSLLFNNVILGIAPFLRGLYACGCTCGKLRLILYSLWFMMVIAGYIVCVALSVPLGALFAAIRLSNVLLPWMHVFIVGYVGFIGVIMLTPRWTGRGIKRLIKAGE